MESLLVLNASADPNTFTKSKLDLLFYDNYQPFINYMEYYRLIINFGGICYALYLIKERKKQREIYQMFPMVVFIGAFLFQIIWEAKSRYILFYMPFFILCATIGYGYLISICNNIIRKKDKE